MLIFSIFAISAQFFWWATPDRSPSRIAAFGAVGGYIAAYLSTTVGIAFWPALVAGAFGAGFAGVLMSLPALRLSPEYLVLLTIAVSSIVLAIVGAVPELGGAYGMIATKAANLAPLPGGDLLFPRQWVLPLILFTAFTYLVCHRMGESAWGRVLRAIRDDEIAARALGCNVFAFKVVVFGITSRFCRPRGGIALLLQPDRVNECLWPGRIAEDFRNDNFRRSRQLHRLDSRRHRAAAAAADAREDRAARSGPGVPDPAGDVRAGSRRTGPRPPARSAARGCVAV